MTVTREGNFTRASIEELDEAEIFEGAENTLTMTQTYTWEFQCKYELQRYPFDAQVNPEAKVQIIFQSQECKIEMTVESLVYETVELNADKVEMKGFNKNITEFSFPILPPYLKVSRCS